MLSCDLSSSFVPVCVVVVQKLPVTPAFRARCYLVIPSYRPPKSNVLCVMMTCRQCAELAEELRACLFKGERLEYKGPSWSIWFAT